MLKLTAHPLAKPSIIQATTYQKALNNKTLHSVNYSVQLCLTCRALVLDEGDWGSVAYFEASGKTSIGTALPEISTTLLREVEVPC